MADLKVRLSGYLPAAEMDGLQPLLQGLVETPKDRRVVVGIIDVQTRRDHGDGEYEPTVRLLQIEAPQGDLTEQALDVLHKAYAARTGAMQMFTDGDPGADWGVGGQAGKPLNPAQPEDAPLGDQPADPDQPDWQDGYPEGQEPTDDDTTED